MYSAVPLTVPILFGYRVYMRPFIGIFTSLTDIGDIGIRANFSIFFALQVHSVT